MTLKWVSMIVLSFCIIFLILHDIFETRLYIIVKQVLQSPSKFMVWASKRSARKTSHLRASCLEREVGVCFFGASKYHFPLLSLATIVITEVDWPTIGLMVPLGHVDQWLILLSIIMDWDPMQLLDAIEPCNYFISFTKLFLGF